MIARHHQHEAIAAKRIGGEPARIDRAGNDADITDAFGNQADDLVAQALFQVDVDVGMSRQERAQGLGQEFGERIGVGQHPHLAGEAPRIGPQILAQPLGLLQHGASVLDQRPSGWRRRHALPGADQKRGAQRLLHVANAG